MKTSLTDGFQIFVFLILFLCPSFSYSEITQISLPWVNDELPYGLDDDLYTERYNEIERRSNEYRYYYCRRGVLQDHFNVGWFDDDANLYYSPLTDDNPIDQAVGKLESELFLMWIPSTIFIDSSYPEECFRGNGQYVSWRDVRIDGKSYWHPIYDYLQITDAPKGLNYHLFRRLHFIKPKDTDGNPLDENHRKLIILIHGWNPDSLADPYKDGKEFQDLSREISDWLIQNNLEDDWKIVEYNWAVDADTGPAFGDNPGRSLSRYSMDESRSIDTWPTKNGTEAAEVAHVHGQYLGEYLKENCPNLKKVQFIAHSAGTWCARTAAKYLLEKTDDVELQITLLDPYMPKEGHADSALGKCIISRLDTEYGRYPVLLENYYSRYDRDFWGLAEFDGTRQEFCWRNQDIQRQLDASDSDSYSDHSGPIRYYTDTIKKDVNVEIFWQFNWRETGWFVSLPYLELQGISWHPNGSLLNCSGRSYIVENGYLRHIPTVEIYWDWYDWDGHSPWMERWGPRHEISVTQHEIENYSRGWDLGYRFQEEEVVKTADSDRIWLVKRDNVPGIPVGSQYTNPPNGSFWTRHHIVSPNVLRGIIISGEQVGHNYGNPRIVSQAYLNQFTESFPILTPYPEGSLIKVTGDPAVFVISKGGKRLFFNQEPFDLGGWDFANVSIISQEEMNQIPRTYPDITREQVLNGYYLDSIERGPLTIQSSQQDGEPYNPQQSTTIKFYSAQGNDSKIEVEYTTDEWNSCHLVPLIRVPGNSGNNRELNWTTPDVISQKCAIRVISRDDNGHVGYDSSKQFFSITASALPNQLPSPVLATIDVPVGERNFTVRWSNVEEKDSYLLQEDSSVLFDSPANHHIGGLDWYEEYKPVGTYYYRVAAVKNSVTGNWSDVQSAVVQNHVWPGPLTPVNPVDDAVNQSLTLTLQWDCIHPAGEAMTYDVIFYAGHKDSGDGYGASSKIASNIGAKSFSVSDLEYNQEYSWKIIAHDETGQSRDSSWWHFWTLADTTAPTGEILINGGDAETDFHVVILNLSASDSGSGVSYASFSNDGTVWSDWYLYGEQYAGWELNDTHYGGTRALQSTYTVYVRFKDAEGNVSDVYSDNINFTAGSPGAIILNDQTYETIADAMTAASSGDTIYLTEGSYVLRCLSDGNMAIRMEAGVTLMGAGADRTRVIQCASSSGNRFVETASNCAIVGMSLASSWFYVINAEGVDNVLIDSCVIEGASENGIAVFDSMNVTVQRCLLTGNYRGIYSRNAENTNVLNCTVADNSYAGIGITSHEVFIPAELRNNIVMNNPRGFACHNAETIITHNDAYNNTYNYHDITGDLTGTNGNISQDPQFDSDTYNIASGSPCRNTGTNVGLPANGTPDMGWFEYGATGTVSVTSNLASAQFIVYGPDGTYNGSGTSWSQSSLPVGVYAISFSTISNHYTPQFQSVILGHGQTLTFDGTYIADTIPPKGTLHVHYDFYATAFPRVDLTLEMNDDVAGLGDGAQMQFSNDGANWSAMEPYSSLRQDWNLLDYGGDTTTGTKTVFAKVSDALGNWTAVPLLDEILYVPNRRILVVPDDWATLDDAVAAASPGDMVHVEPGTYYSIADLPEGIRLQGSGSDLTTLNISGQDRSLAENSMIDGFNTALLYNYLNKAIISNNRLFGSVNRCISTSGSIVRNNLFDDSSGSSLMVADINTDVSVVNNTFVNASNTNASAIQTAYLNTHDLLPRIENNIIAYNYWGIHDNNSDREHILFVTGFITYWQNSAGNTGGYSSGNDLFGPGCFDADPQFESVTTGDYCLQAGSPCINSGYPEARFNDVDGSRNDRGYTGGPCYNTYPIASFSTTPTIGLCYELILLDASSSSDRESPIDEMYFRWDMNNDGVYDTAYSLVTTTTAILDLPGEYVIGLEVMDRGGFINKTSETIRVIGRHPDSPTTLYPLDDAMDTPTSLTLQWNCTDPDIGDSLTYDVYFGNTSNPPQITTGTAATSITIEALDYSTFYHWRVEARDSAGLITVGDSWSFITEAAPPPNAPEQLVASAVAWNQVELDWTDCSDDELGFRIERKAATEDSWRQVTVSSGAECIDTSVNGGIEYAYRVRAFNASGTSEYDGPTTITTPVAPPSTPYPVFPYNGQTSTPLLLTLDWIDCARADYYNVYLWHAEDDLPSSPVFDSLTSSSVVLVEELDHNTTYSWLVVAYGTGGITSGTVWQFLTEPRYTLLTTAAQGEIETSPSLNLYPPGTTVTLTVTPNDGWQFLNWSGDLESNKITDNPLTLIMNGNKTIIANFEEVSVNVTLEQIRQYLIGIIEFTESQKERADTNGDGKVDVADLINLLEQK